MRTTRPFSTISYNTKGFLKTKLDDLVRRHKIDFYAFVEHQPEADEKGKSHIHLYIEPTSAIDTAQFLDEFLEIDLSDITKKPLRCRPCRSSKFDDWYLYSLHDSAYLASKGQTREYHYTDDDIVVSDEDDFIDLKHHIDWSKINTLGKVIQAAEEGVTFKEFIKTNPVNMLSVRSVQFVFDQFQKSFEYPERAGRSTHSPKEPKFDSDGVLIEE